MPDLKFKGGKFYFSILNPAGSGHPLLVPRITNPTFVQTKTPPGIKELIDGDLGITEQIMKPILAPITKMFTTNPLLAQAVADSNNLEASNSSAIEGAIVSNYVPKDTGLKALEKSVIQGMMESYKPFLDFAKLFFEMIGIAEDVFCRFLGTSIKILGKEIGFPSRNPAYWGEEFNYAETMTHSLEKFIKAGEDAEAEYQRSMSDDNPIKNNVPKGAEKVQGSADQDAYYIGYFDEEGTAIEPPKWVLDSNKWFRREVPDADGNLQVLSAPFEQLSPEMYEGVDKLSEKQQKEIAKLQRDKRVMLKSIDERIKDAENIKDEKLKKNEIDSLNAEKEEAKGLFDSLITTIQDILDGTNKGGNNFVDPNDPTKGVNSPASLGEWIGKVKSAQLRQKYYPEQVSTVQSIIDRKGKGKDPYVNIPKVNVKFKGRNVKVESPLAFSNQITQKDVISSNTFFETVKRYSFQDDRLRRRYSTINQVSSLNLYYGTDRVSPFVDDNKTHFSRDIKKEYVPDNIKNYYLPMEWEEVFEYDIRNKRTKEVIRTEKEIVPFKIDIEKDYEIRLIKVVNRPLNRNGVNEEFFTERNINIINEESVIEFEANNGTNGTNGTNIVGSILNIQANIPEEFREEIRKLELLSPFELRLAINNGTINKNLLQYLNIDTEGKLRLNFFSEENISRLQRLETDSKTGTLFADSANIPEQYNIENPDLSADSTPDINENNLLKEGIIYHGLDPRFIDKDRYKVFWLVEAIKKDSRRDIAPINGKYNRNEVANAGGGGRNDNRGKEWYGLIDKFTAIPQIAIKLIPLISSKLIPMIIKIIQLVSNPTKIKDFLISVGIKDEGISKFPQNFKQYNEENRGKTKSLKDEDIPKDLDEADSNPDQSTKTVYMGIQEGKDNRKKISNTDGQAQVEFGKGAFGKSIVDIGLEIEGGEYKTIDKKEEQTDFNKPPKKREQSTFTFILNMMKLPFEIIFKIFKWIIDWIKKMLNPVNIPSAMAEFLSFKWLLDILGKDSIYGILGLLDADTDAMTANTDGQDLFDKTLKALRGGDPQFLEVLIYDILKNGRKIDTEVVTRPYNGNDASKTSGVNGDGTGDGDGDGDGDGVDLGDGNNGNSEGLGFCGVRFFNIEEIFPIPFFPKMPSYNACETPQIFLKPLEMITGFLKFLQGVINGMLSMPSAILGLEPTIALPKFGKEIPFANVLEDLLERLRKELTPIDMNG
jgi:hypothetical protein